MLSASQAPIPTGTLEDHAPQTALLAFSPQTATVWFTEPTALVAVEAAFAVTTATDATGIKAVAATDSAWTATASYVAARMLGKLTTALTAEITPVDGSVVLVSLVRYVDANAAAETIGSIASLLGHKTDPARLVLAILQRDGMLAPAAAEFDLSSLPAEITAVAVAPGTRWRQGGRAVHVVEVDDIYAAYRFVTNQPLPHAATAIASLPTTTVPLSHYFAQLVPLWPNILIAAHDHGSPPVRSIAMRCLAAARASEWSRQHGDIDAATIWMREALVLGRALQLLTANPASTELPRPQSASRAVDAMRTKTMAEALLPAQKAEEDELLRQLSLLRRGAAPTEYPAYGAPPSSATIAIRLGTLRQLGAQPPATLIRWWQQAHGLLSLSPPTSLIDTAHLRELHLAASQRLYQIAMLLDHQIDARVRELIQASLPSRPSP